MFVRKSFTRSRIKNKAVYDWFLSLNSLRSLGIVGFTTAVMGIRKDGINIKFLQKIIEGTNFLTILCPYRP